VPSSVICLGVAGRLFVVDALPKSDTPGSAWLEALKSGYVVALSEKPTVAKTDRYQQIWCEFGVLLVSSA
jgi:hypothetical protein